MELPPHDDALAAFERARPRLFGIAYRMLGSAAEAEDIVQETWVRWQTADRSAVRDAQAFLATAATRLAINAAQSARARRETYVGPWLPEPVDTSADPALGAERGEALELAVLRLLEQLPPRERAAYVLREAFDYPYPQIASVLQVGEANTRQIVTRARRHLAEARPAPVSNAEHRRLLAAFIAAAQQGDLAALERLFVDDIVSYSDGNGRAGVARLPVVGRELVARFVANIATRQWAAVQFTWVEANGQAGLLITGGEPPVVFATISASAQGIEQLLWVVGEEKLGAMMAALGGSDGPPSASEPLRS
ncbi:RNA polymerase sigma-70 factor [Chloroflexia bacterium SDU3-3]|nr:RNA polymerase sigma-70 factor [Chloroflexia bacterium SDU3-3]